VAARRRRPPRRWTRTIRLAEKRAPAPSPHAGAKKYFFRSVDPTVMDSS
jgi:hypothetical protein